MNRIRPALVAGAVGIVIGLCHPASAEEGDYNQETSAAADSLADGVRVVLARLGGVESVQSVSGGSTSSSTCVWTSRPATSTNMGDVIASPSEIGAETQSVLYVLFCNGQYYGTVWVAPTDIVDVDAAVRAEAERYVREVLVPAVHIGVNPTGAGLVGLGSWFWIEGFTGSVTAPPISAFGMIIEVRMTSQDVTWDFGDGTSIHGDLGRAYPEESTVQHVHQSHGSFPVTADIQLVPEYRVDGGPWLTLPDLTASTTTTHPVEQRQPIITER